MDAPSETGDLAARLDEALSRERGIETASRYSDRAVPPAETVARMRAHLPRMGITRAARVTGLDRIGIPVWVATRPNGMTLAVSQGKGIDDDAAAASAIMEAAEFFVAEQPARRAR